MISDTLREALVKVDRYLSVDDFYGINDEYRAIVDVRKHMARVCAMLDTPPSGRRAARRSGLRSSTSCARRRTDRRGVAEIRATDPLCLPPVCPLIRAVSRRLAATFLPQQV
jgi:hypothetical protein